MPARAPKAKRAGRLASYRAKRDFARHRRAGRGGGDGPSGARTAVRDPRAPTRRACTGTCAWSATACSSPGRFPRGSPRSPRTTTSPPRTEDHPLEYVDFEGEIPKGEYGAGTMKIWDRGTYECLKWEPRKVEVALHGERVDARYALFAIGDGEDRRRTG